MAPQSASVAPSHSARSVAARAGLDMGSTLCPMLSTAIEEHSEQDTRPERRCEAGEWTCTDATFEAIDRGSEPLARITKGRLRRLACNDAGVAGQPLHCLANRADMLTEPAEFVTQRLDVGAQVHVIIAYFHCYPLCCCGVVTVSADRHTDVSNLN